MRFQNGQVNPYNPTIPNLAVTPQSFARMSLDSQKDIIARNSSIGWQGEVSPDWFVPPQCQKGITLGEMIELDNYVDVELQKAGQRKSKDVEYKSRLKAIKDAQDENEKNAL